MRKGQVTKSDADHYIAQHNAPIRWARQNPRAPLSIQFEEGHEITDEIIDETGGNPLLHFWGFEKVIAVVDLIRERRADGHES